MSEKQGLPADNSLRSDNSAGSTKGHTRNLKFFYSSSEVTRTAPSPAPKGFQAFSFPELYRYEVPELNSCKVTQARQESCLQDESLQAAPILACACLISVIFLLCKA